MIARLAVTITGANPQKGTLKKKKKKKKKDQASGREENTGDTNSVITVQVRVERGVKNAGAGKRK